MTDKYKTFTVLMSNISRSIKKLKTAEMAKLNLKSTHVSCLYYLYEKKKLTVGELCEICNEDKANISRSLDYLKENGYIENVLDNNRRYKAPMKLTEKGFKIGASLSARVNEVVGGVVVGLKEEEINIMYKCLELISGNLQKIK